MRIIVVDSDSMFTSSFEQRCKRSSVFCQVYANGANALAEIKKNPDVIDLVLIAKELGGQDGLTVAQVLRKDAATSDIPYVILSNVWGKSEFAKHQKTESGANAYYNKKSPLLELEGIIESVTGFKFSAASDSSKSKPTPSGNGTSVQLRPVSEVIRVNETNTGEISISEPISLFSDNAFDSGTSASAALVMPPTIMTAPVVTVNEAFGSTLNVSLTEPEAQPASTSSVGSTHTIAAAPPALPTSVAVDTIAPITIDFSAPGAMESSSLEVASVAVKTEVALSTPPAVSVAPSPVSEEEAAKDLPYLFTDGVGGRTRSIVAQLPTSHANIDVAVGGPLSNDVETLKKYLAMREQDVSVLTVQLTYAKEELAKSEEQIKRLTLQGEDLFHQIDDFKKRILDLEQERQHAGKSMEGEVDQLRFELKSKIDRIRFLDDRLSDSAQQYEKLKDRVRLDIRKIRVREKELESKLEILKKDSETLIGARENKILELKRKIDLLEFNYDTLQDRTEIEKQNVVKGNEKLERVLKVLKLALGMIEAEGEQHSGRKDSSDIKAA